MTEINTVPQDTVFDKNYALYGIAFVVLLLANPFFGNWRLCILLIIYCPILLFSESRLAKVMHDMETSSAYFGRSAPLFLLANSVLLLCTSTLGVCLLQTDLAADFGVTSSYMLSLFESLVIFNLSACIKCFLVGSGCLGLRNIRRGCLGVFQRVFILIRNIAITPIWIRSFCPTCDSMKTLFFGNVPFLCYEYIAVKGILQLYLLWDFGSALREFRANGRTSLVNADASEVEDICVVCQDTPYEPVKLPCGHIFCYACAYRWLGVNPSCPICRAVVIRPSPIEFGDGSMPIIPLFIAV